MCLPSGCFSGFFSLFDIWLFYYCVTRCEFLFIYPLWVIFSFCLWTLIFDQFWKPFSPVSSFLYCFSSVLPHLSSVRDSVNFVGLAFPSSLSLVHLLVSLCGGLHHCLSFLFQCSSVFICVIKILIALWPVIRSEYLPTLNLENTHPKKTVHTKWWCFPSERIYICHCREPQDHARFGAIFVSA